jgi:hypothetical protein
MRGARGQRRGVLVGQIDPNLTIRYATTKYKIFGFLFRESQNFFLLQLNISFSIPH